MNAPAADDIARAAKALRAGGLVAFPTETVYGLGADAANPDAVRRLYRVKSRPATHPVIVHLGSRHLLDDYAIDVSDLARALADACWPGPLTLVVRRRAGRIVDEVTGGRDTVGLRVPDHPVALELLDAFGGGIAAPSANRFGRVSPTTASHVMADLGEAVDVMLDGGACAVGVESTIVDCSTDEPAILRVGGVTLERISGIAGRDVLLRTHGEVAAPGTTHSHYAPSAIVEVVVRDAVVARASGLLAQGLRVGLLAIDPPGALPTGVVVLDSPENSDDFARVLYARLREADVQALDVLLTVEPAGAGLGAAVSDRLRRAAAREIERDDGP